MTSLRAFRPFVRHIHIHIQINVHKYTHAHQGTYTRRHTDIHRQTQTIIGRVSRIKLRYTTVLAFSAAFPKYVPPYLAN